MHILLTRPLEDSLVLAKEIEERGYSSIISPVLSITFKHFSGDILKGATALIATSQNAIRALQNISAYDQLPLFVVGGQTADLAEQKGFKNVFCAEGTVESLEKLIVDKIQPTLGQKLLHIGGDVVRGDLSGSLKGKSIHCERAEIYQTREISHLTEEALKALRGNAIKAVLLYSPRSASIFVKLLQKYDLLNIASSMVAICLSHAVSEALKEINFKNSLVVPGISHERMLSFLDEV